MTFRVCPKVTQKVARKVTCWPEKVAFESLFGFGFLACFLARISSFFRCASWCVWGDLLQEDKKTININNFRSKAFMCCIALGETRKLRVVETVVLENGRFVPCRKQVVLTKIGGNSDIAFYPQKQGILLLKPRKSTKMTKMAGVTPTKWPFAKSTVLTTLRNKWKKKKTGNVRKMPG